MQFLEPSGNSSDMDITDIILLVCCLAIGGYISQKVYDFMRKGKWKD